MDTMQEAFELEKHIISKNQWDEKVPAFVIAMAKLSVDEGIPTAIAFSEKLGWCILHAGQGPYIAWSER